MTGQKIDTNAIIDGATTDGDIDVATATTAATTVTAIADITCREIMPADRADGLSTCAGFTTRTDGPAIQQPLKTCYRAFAERSEPVAEAVTATTAGTATTN